MTIIKRADLGRPLTWDELDDNFQQVDDLTAAASAAVSSAAASATAAAGSATNSLNSANSASSSAADAAASAASAIDALMNSTFEPSDFDFTSGGTLGTTDRNKAVYNPADNNWYSWSGTLPKIVSAGEDPTADSNWKPRTDQILRSDLNSTAEGKGGTLVKLVREGTVQQALDNIFTLKGLGVAVDGTDQTTSLVQAIYTASLYNGVIDGRGASVTVSDSITIDLHKAGLKNITINYVYPNGAEPTSPTCIVKLEGSTPSPSANTKMVFERVAITGPVPRSIAPMHGLLINPSANLANLLIDNCSVSQVNSAVVFGSNSYLINFNNFTASRYNIAISDTVATGIEASISNAGENIRFYGGVLANGNSFCTLNGIEATISFSKMSFDYSGGKVGTNIKQWVLSRQGINMFYDECHFESGNVNDGVTDNYFHATESVNVVIRGGWMVYGSTTYNDCPYFFYDETGGKSTFSLDGTRLFGLGIKKWANVCPVKFLPAINYDASSTRSYISDKSRMVADQGFAASSFVDDWYVSGTRTSKTDSDQASVVLGYTTDSAGNTVKALVVTKKPSVVNSVIYLVAPRPNNDFGPSLTFNVKADTAVTLSTPIYVTASLMKGNSIRDAFGVEGANALLSTWTTNITALDTTTQTVSLRGSLGRNQAFLGYDKVLIAINISSLPSANVFYITDFNLQQAWG